MKTGLLGAAMLLASTEAKEVTDGLCPYGPG